MNSAHRHVNLNEGVLANACTLGCPWPNNVCPKQPRFLLSRIQTLNNGATSPWSTATTRCLLAARPTGYATAAHYRRSHQQSEQNFMPVHPSDFPANPPPPFTLMPFSSSYGNARYSSRIVPQSPQSSIGTFYRNFSRNEKRVGHIFFVQIPFLLPLTVIRSFICPQRPTSIDLSREIESEIGSCE